MATPSSKQNPGATPTHLTSSPHPSAVPMARPLSYKSPSTRTPSASGHGHNVNHPGISSHQYATPLAAAVGVDDPVTFSSPSALLALGGYTGISPSPAAHDALVGAAMSENEIQALSMQGIKLGASRDNEEERRRHIEEVVQLLRTRVAGRGVCREGIERLSQLEGLESIWQEDNLNIAGNFVDLEIEFHPGQDTVKDVSLTYVTLEATDGERREEATAVLKSDLTQSPEQREQGAWKSLNGFYKNLQWLAKLDRLSQEVNCFEAIEGLHASLKRIWDAEDKQSRWAGTYEHLCSGWIGRPCLHKGKRVGLGLDYWISQPRVLDAKRAKTSTDAMVIDQPPDRVSNEHSDDEQNLWSLKVECEEGYPSLRVSRDWVGPDVLTTTPDISEDSSSNRTPDSALPMINWADPPPTVSSASMGHPDPMNSMLGPHTPNRRFVVKLEPPLDVPILAASDIYRTLGIQLPQEFKMIAYDALLVPAWPPLSPTHNGTSVSRGTGVLCVPTYNAQGEKIDKRHAYTFQSFEAVIGRTISELPFSHPRQLADILPILRQYAALSSIVRRTFTSSPDRREPNTQPSTSESVCKAPEFPDPEAFASGSGIVMLSNDDPNEERLDSILGGGQLSNVAFGPVGDDSHQRRTDVKVDVTLRTQLGQPPVLMLLITANNGSDKATRSERISISFEVGLNGSISIVDSTGLWGDETGTSVESSDMKTVDEKKQEALEAEKKIARVLETSHDLSVLVEWVLSRS
ncbi:hypothetical protein ASPZODRAFT_129711 [Penicilliopsis zonata CBS 506.65]|uniref:Mediator of RNA polymerase II transcription subunit 1 n=1 Tax=Penicilliopsis zonata CBS 506.65 TaxID=1073090 RepID=A0A1L9SPZ1_9EURO|nr:hypothetical protein ASPZODRAFT_129711 [Penicilliopsis zonata CBS 506.65]OJJ49280.1 hypothetical protein ASPZODRAFT_129711 [Penicilliopsis zonata CBS 506.65]